MKRTLLLLMIATVCYSFQTGINTSKSKTRVKTIVHIQSKDSSEYFYKPDGHISRIRNSKGNNIAYEYLSNRILRRYNDVARGKSFVDTMILNKNGLVAKITSDNSAVMMQERQFNNEKYVSQNISTSYHKDSAIRYYNTYEYQNGNEVTAILADGSGGIHSTITSTYYADKMNTIGSENLGSDFAGASSKNPVKSILWRPAAGSGVDPVTTVFNYHYDDKGRIIIKVSYDAKSGRLQDSVAYTYY